MTTHSNRISGGAMRTISPRSTNRCSSMVSCMLYTSVTDSAGQERHTQGCNRPRLRTHVRRHLHVKSPRELRPAGFVDSTDVRESGWCLLSPGRRLATRSLGADGGQFRLGLGGRVEREVLLIAGLRHVDGDLVLSFERPLEQL